MIEHDNIDMLFLYLVMTALIIMLIVVAVNGAIFLMTGQEYELERPCIDENGGEFKDEVCEVTVTCTEYIPEFFDMLNKPDCKYVPGWRK